MKTSLIIAIVSSLPLLAQEPAPAPQPEAPAPAPQGGQAQPQGQGMHRGHGRHMQGPRGQHRGMMNPEQRKQMLEKFDTDKDGKLSDEERKAMREEFMKNRPQRPQMPGQPGAQGPQGPRGPHRGMMDPEQQKKMLEKFDTDKDGKLSDEERKAAREEFMKNHPQMPGRRGPRGGHGGWHHGPQGGPQQAPAPQQGEQPAPAPAPEQPAPAPQA